MSNNELNNFDQLLKSKLDQHSVPFNEGEWSRLEKNLPKKVSAPLFKNPWIWSGAAVVAILLTSVFLLNTNTENQLDDTIVVNVNKENNKLNKVSPEDIEHQNNKTIKTVISNNVEENTNIDNTAQESFKSQDNSDIAEQDEQSNTKDAETIASNNETEALENTVPTVDSSLSPSYTPEDFNEAVNVKKPDAKISYNSIEECAGSKFIFETSDQKDVDFLWSFGDETFSKEQNPVHVFNKPGSYKVGLIVRSKIDNSIVTKAKELLVHVLALPNVNFESEETVTKGIPAISFINTTDKASHWSWNLGDGNISIEKDPYHNYRRKGLYNVSLTATNKEGCVSTVTKKVYIENDYNLLAPNSFTPNGDGINDFFIPEALKVMDVEFSMRVFSQSQGLLFETKNINQQWDGVNQQTGEKCNEGNYIWVVTLTNNEGQVEQYKGAVLILE